MHCPSSELKLCFFNLPNFIAMRLTNHIGPSEVRATSGANLGRPVFLAIIPLLLLAAVTKIAEGVVIGFQIFAWAPKSHKY